MSEEKKEIRKLTEADFPELKDDNPSPGAIYCRYHKRTWSGWETIQCTSASIPQKMNAQVVHNGLEPTRAPDRDSIERGALLKEIKNPQLFLQGTRDKLANIDLLKPPIKKIRTANIEVIAGGDQEFPMKKLSLR